MWARIGTAFAPATARIGAAFSGIGKGKVAAGAAGAGAVVGYSVAEGGPPNPVGKIFSGASKIIFVGGLIVVAFILLRKSYGPKTKKVSLCCAMATVGLSLPCLGCPLLSVLIVLYKVIRQFLMSVRTFNTLVVQVTCIANTCGSCS